MGVAAAVAAKEALVVVETVVEVWMEMGWDGMVEVGMETPYGCWAQLLSRPYPAFRVFFLHQHHPAGPQISFFKKS